MSLQAGGADGKTLTDLVQRWANEMVPSAAVQIRAHDEADLNGGKTFVSSEAVSGGPSLSVTYEDLVADDTGGGPTAYETLSESSWTFDQAMQQLVGDRYAYHYHNDSTFFLGVVSPTANDISQAQSQAQALGVTATVLAAPYSEIQIQGYQSQVDSIGVAAPEGVFFSSWFDPMTGRLNVQLTSWHEATVAQMQSALPSGLLQITVDPTIKFESSDSRSTYPPYKAGRLIKDQQTGGKCTSGYTVIINSGPNAGLSQGTTAGHCTRSQHYIYGGPNYSVFVGTANMNFFWSQSPANSDSTLIGIAQAYATNDLYVNSSFTRQVVGSRGFKVPNSGCISVPSHTSCGWVVNSVNRTIWYIKERKFVYHLTCWNDKRSQEGDSGGPIYTRPGPNTAKAGGLYAGNLWVNGQHKGSCFDPMPNVLRYTDTHVRTS